MPLLKKKSEKKARQEKDPKKEKKAATKKKEVSINSQAFRVLEQPRVTEKGSFLGSLNQYIFSICVTANKREVRKAIEELYSVKVTKVNIMNVKGKERKSGRTRGRTRAWKKAIVTLKQGDTIKLFEGV